MQMLAHLDECMLRGSMHRTRPGETPEIARIEALSFPADEKATPEGVAMRQKEAGEFFWTLGPVQGMTSTTASAASEEPLPVWGFVNGTCTTHSEVTEESMETHEPEGTTLIIHSVVIHPDHRRKGLATAMLSYYLERMCENSRISRILLIAKGNLLGFYTSVGFKVLRLSPVVHGLDPWFEMSLDLSEKRRGIQFHVDAFATEPYKGNQAAVVFQHYSESEMQQLAAENNFAETAFVQRIFPDDASLMSSPEPEFYLRWYTPTAEIELCGHATVAATHALYERGLFDSKLITPDCNSNSEVVGSIKFQTKYRGVLRTRVVKSGASTVMYELNFPGSMPLPSPLSTEDRAHVCAALHISEQDIICEAKAIDDVVIELKTEAFQQVPAYSSGLIDINRLNSVCTARGVIITCAAPSSCTPDFLSRFFCPKLGVDEDPVTGSAHCQLAPYWCSKLATNKLLGYQKSERGGYVTVQVVPPTDSVHEGQSGTSSSSSSSASGRVLLQGSAVTVMSSYLHYLKSS